MLIKFGAVVTQASGALGSTTFSSRRGAPVVAMNPLKTDQQTTAQFAQRAAYSAAIAAWHALAPGAQFAWNLYAYRSPRPNRLGTFRRLTGMQFFLREAILRIRHGIPCPMYPPTKGQQGIGVPAYVQLFAGGPYTVVMYAPTPDPIGWYVFGINRPMSKISYKANRFRVLPARAISGSANFDLFDDASDLVGLFEAGELAALQIRYAGASSLTSAAMTLRLTITAP